MKNKNEIKEARRITEALHSAAAALHQVEALDKATLRDFDLRHLRQKVRESER